jgi:hypothetical protein
MTEHLISRPAVLDTCPRCGRPILVGMDTGQLARADPTPLDPEKELLALLADQMTYDVQPLGLPRRPFLIYRTTLRIQRARKWTVVTTHKCPPPPYFPGPRKPAVELVVPFGLPITDDPPF